MQLFCSGSSFFLGVNDIETVLLSNSSTSVNCNVEAGFFFSPVALMLVCSLFLSMQMNLIIPIITWMSEHHRHRLQHFCLLENDPFNIYEDEILCCEVSGAAGRT